VTILAYVSTMEDGTRVFQMVDTVPRADGILVDDTHLLDPDEKVYGLPAGEWGDGIWAVTGDTLSPWHGPDDELIA
jgi:hypothetical protein